MRKATILALLGWLAVGPAGAQKAEKLPAGTNLLTRWLDVADIHPPVRSGRLTVFPVSVRLPRRLTGLLTMDEALGKKLLVIEELKSARVSQARFINKSGSQMIFLMAGEVITGGKQNRTLVSDALLGPDSTTVLGLYCVQRRRWSGGAKFAGATTIAPQAVRAKAAQKAGQDEVWAEVARANRRLGGADASEDLSVPMNRPENVKRLAKRRRHIHGKLPSETAGVVVAWAGRIVGADLFNSPELFAAMRDKVLDSYLSEYGWDEPVPIRRGVAAAPSQMDVRSYLQGCYRAGFTAGEMRGVGRMYHVRGARHGETLGYRRAYPIPLKGERRSRVRPMPARQYMVHTALMERVVPVRPTPRPAPPVRPIPRPRPPRKPKPRREE